MFGFGLLFGAFRKHSSSRGDTGRWTSEVSATASSICAGKLPGLHGRLHRSCLQCLSLLHRAHSPGSPRLIRQCGVAMLMWHSRSRSLIWRLGRVSLIWLLQRQRTSSKAGAGWVCERSMSVQTESAPGRSVLHLIFHKESLILLHPPNIVSDITSVDFNVEATKTWLHASA